LIKRLAPPIVKETSKRGRSIPLGGFVEAFFGNLFLSSIGFPLILPHAFRYRFFMSPNAFRRAEDLPEFIEICNSLSSLYAYLFYDSHETSGFILS
jgi:hypothetical protein